MIMMLDLNVYGNVMQRVSEATFSAPDIARNNMRGGHGANSKNNTLNSAARRRMEDRLFTRNAE